MTYRHTEIHSILSVDRKLIGSYFDNHLIAIFQAKKANIFCFFHVKILDFLFFLHIEDLSNLFGICHLGF